MILSPIYHWFARPSVKFTLAMIFVVILVVTDANACLTSRPGSHINVSIYKIVRQDSSTWLRHSGGMHRIDAEASRLAKIVSFLETQQKERRKVRLTMEGNNRIVDVGHVRRQNIWH